MNEPSPNSSRFSLPGAAIGVGVGAALCVSNGPAVGVSIGAALTLLFGLSFRKRC